MVSFSKLNAALITLASTLYGGADAFSVSPSKVSVASRTYAGALSMSTTDQTAVENNNVPSKNDERRRILKQPFFHRRGFQDTREEVEDIMNQEYKSAIIQEMRDNGYELQRGNLKIKLAKEFGFCWGVERAVAMAVEARKHFKDQKLHLTNEIIHNPQVNEQLDAMDINLIKVDKDTGIKDFGAVESGDVVILPAFGATLEEMKMMEERGVNIVDTTCPWVSKVWNTVDKHTKLDMTSVIHGKYAHEETVATASFADNYIIVKNIEEAEYVANYIKRGEENTEEDDKALLSKFAKAISVGFNPRLHLNKVGLANQTTMYKRETREIGQLLQRTMMERFGPQELDAHYIEFDTICDATQERQDAITELIEPNVASASASASGSVGAVEGAVAPEDKLDLVVVVGGWDSSNTAHLKEIPELAGVTNYHIDRAGRIGPDNTIKHRLLNGEIVVTENFLPLDRLRQEAGKAGKEFVVGLTSGASTPDAYLQETLDALLLLHATLQEQE